MNEHAPAADIRESWEWAVRFYDGEVLEYDDEEDARRHGALYGGEVVTRKVTATPWEPR